MSRKSHYTILGIGRGETSEGIRAAYLRCVKALHPDHAGASSTPAFREVQRAYDVLSNPTERRAYDEQLDHSPTAGLSRARAVTQGQGVEPLVPIHELTNRPAVEPLSPLGDVRRRQRSVFTPIEPLRDRTTVAIDLEVGLSPELAERGGALDVVVPAAAICRVCGGSGIDRRFPCVVCRGRGEVAAERILRLTLPPGIRHGTIVHLRPQASGGGDLSIRFVIDNRMRAPPWW